jgi:purine-nucleoside phosphorylase
MNDWKRQKYMDKFVTLEEIDQTAQAVRSRLQATPRAGLILGSGLGSLADASQPATVIPYRELPNWPVSTVPGHEGRLVIGTLEGQLVLMMQGRVHYYEGYSMSQVVLPVRVMQRLGIECLIVTNAAGAVNPDFEPGDLMLITDHLNLVGMAGENPLRGPNLDEIGPRFPDISRPYDPQMSETAKQVAAHHSLHLHKGVYAYLAGPSFESPAELRYLRSIGADSVGMSTVPEVITARHGGMRVLGISTISNKANLDGNTITTHEEVLAAGEIIVPRLTTLVKGVVQLL